MEQEARKNFLINVLYFLTIAAGIFILCRFLFRYLLPFAVGAVIAWLVQKPADFLAERLPVKRSLCAAAMALLLFLLAAVLLVFAGFKLFGAAGGLLGEISDCAGKIGDYFSTLQNHIHSYFSGFSEEITAVFRSVYDTTLKEVVARFSSGVTAAAGQAAKGTPAFLVSLIVSAVASCYIAADFPGLMRFGRSLCGKRIYTRVLRIKDIFLNSIVKLIKGYALLMLLTFVELLIGLLILRIRYAPLLAALIAVIDVLPVLGTGTVLIPWAAIEFLFGNTALGAGLIAVYAVIAVVRNFAEPKIIGGQMGINPLFTLLSMFIGLKLFGFWGMLLLPILFIVVIKYYKDEMEQESVQG